MEFKSGTSGAEGAARLLKRSADIGRLGGGIPKAMEQWVVEGWLYIIIMSAVIGIVIGYGSMIAIKFGLRRKWIDSESFLLWPAAIGVSLASSLDTKGRSFAYTTLALYHWCLRHARHR